MMPAERAGGNGSRNARRKAGMRTFLRVTSLKCCATFPRHIVVFVLMPGSSSICNFAKLRSKWLLIVRSDSFGASTSIDLIVCSRRTGDASANPFMTCGNTCWSTTAGFRCSPYESMCCSSCMRRARSVLEKRRTTTGTTFFSYSSDETHLAAFRRDVSACEPPLPYSMAPTSSGKILWRHASGGNESMTSGRRRKKSAFSPGSLIWSSSRKRDVSTNGLHRKPLGCIASFRNCAAEALVRALAEVRSRKRGTRERGMRPASASASARSSCPLNASQITVPSPHESAECGGLRLSMRPCRAISGGR
eukprot:Opistho-2@22655